MNQCLFCIWTPSFQWGYVLIFCPPHLSPCEENLDDAFKVSGFYPVSCWHILDVHWVNVSLMQPYLCVNSSFLRLSGCYRNYGIMAGTYYKFHFVIRWFHFSTRSLEYSCWWIWGLEYQLTGGYWLLSNDLFILYVHAKIGCGLYYSPERIGSQTEFLRIDYIMEPYLMQCCKTAHCLQSKGRRRLD